MSLTFFYEIGIDEVRWLQDTIEDEDEFKAIRIKGGGGTAFLPIFH